MSVLSIFETELTPKEELDRQQFIDEYLDDVVNQYYYPRYKERVIQARKAWDKHFSKLNLLRYIPVPPKKYQYGYGGGAANPPMPSEIKTQTMDQISGSWENITDTWN